MTANYDPAHEYHKSIKWFVGSEHGTDENPEYRYDIKGWPFFIGIKETRPGHTDYHIAIGIQSLATAKYIASLHNTALLVNSART